MLFCFERFHYPRSLRRSYLTDKLTHSIGVAIDMWWICEHLQNSNGIAIFFLLSQRHRIFDTQSSVLRHQVERLGQATIAMAGTSMSCS